MYYEYLVNNFGPHKKEAAAVGRLLRRLPLVSRAMPQAAQKAVNTSSGIKRWRAPWKLWALLIGGKLLQAKAEANEGEYAPIKAPYYEPEPDTKLLPDASGGSTPKTDDTIFKRRPDGSLGWD